VLADHNRRIGQLKRCRPGQQLKCGAREGVFVGPAVEIQPLELFWSAVGDRAHHHIGLGKTADVTELSGDAEKGAKMRRLRAVASPSKILAGLTSRCSIRSEWA
jgi:hypothetical protein